MTNRLKTLLVMTVTAAALQASCVHMLENQERFALDKAGVAKAMDIAVYKHPMRKHITVAGTRPVLKQRGKGAGLIVNAPAGKCTELTVVLPGLHEGYAYDLAKGQAQASLSEMDCGSWRTHARHSVKVTGRVHLHKVAKDHLQVNFDARFEMVGWEYFKFEDVAKTKTDFRYVKGTYKFDRPTGGEQEQIITDDQQRLMSVENYENSMGK